jgi:hypothetical protein
LAPFIPLLALNRSSKVRIGGQRIPSFAQALGSVEQYEPNDLDGPVYVDLGATTEPGTPVWKEIAYHASIGQVVVAGPIVSDLNAIEGLFSTADGSDLVITLSPGVITSLTAASGTPAVTSGGGTTTLSAASGSHPRIDLIEVNLTTGVIGHVTGTAVASPVAPAPGTGNVGIANVLVGTSVTLITQANVTDVAPRATTDPFGRG